MSITVKRGWLREVNGLPVAKCPARYHGGYWPSGPPIGILFHYTAGCGSDLRGVFNERHVSANFSVDRDGNIYEYVALRKYAYHAYDMSRVRWGVEHSALPGTCELTDVQLDASAKLMAGLIEYTKRKWGYDIPLVKLEAPVPAPGKPGFLDHRDGVEESWNPNTHTDHLYSRSWKSYLAAIAEVLGPAGYTLDGGKLRTLKDLIARLRSKLRAGKPGDVHKVKVV